MSNYCMKKFPPTIKRDTIIEEKIIYKDTLIYVYVPADTIIQEKQLYKTLHDTIVLHKYNSDTVKAELSYSKAMSWVQLGNLKLNLIQKDSLLEYKFDSLLKEKETVKKLYEKQTQYIDTTKWKSFKKGVIVGGISLLILLLLIKIGLK